MSEFQPFVMERMMSKFEQGVDYNLSESGVHPLLLGELLADHPDLVGELLSTELNYPHVNGSPELRGNIAALYDGANADNVLATVGAIEANYITIRTLLAAGDEIVVMLPNYMQIWGLAKNHGYRLKTFHLQEELGWAPDIAELEAKVSPDTKLIAVCNPNNPTGRVLAEAEMDQIVAVADRVGAWVLADEVYSGAERLTDVQSPSFYGRYDRVLATGSTSKAYGLPGLRLGWVVGPPDAVDDIWARHEYITLSATTLSNKLGALALSPEVRPRIINRTRGFIRRGYPILQTWIDAHPGMLSVTPPDAAAIAFVRYHADIGSTELFNRILEQQSVLVVPGDHFGLDSFLRISFGLPHDYLRTGLDRIHQVLAKLER